MTTQPLTVGDVLRYLEPADFRVVPRWPPTAFGIVATILRHSGGYIRAVNRWPPFDPPEGWVAFIRRIGKDWRDAAVDPALPIPAKVQEWWDVAVSKEAESLDLLCEDQQEELCKRLVEILAAADEASVGVGLPPPEDAFEERALTSLAATSRISGGQNATLCREISPSRFTVLPKLHTPQTGITIRSLSHHLALCPGSDVTVRWLTSLSPDVGDSRFNLLVVPWPFVVSASQFSPVSGGKGIGNLANGYGFFDYAPPTEDPAPIVGNVLSKAERLSPIDCVVLPELAVTRPQYMSVRQEVFRGRENLSLVSGAVEESIDPLYSRNFAIFSRFVAQADVTVEQDKHHRWKLDKKQIEQYQLSGQLDTGKQWWESCRLTRRSITFIPLRSWLTICVVVCEDLARPDPLSDVIRSVGPNLVIAILMDGPQMYERWSARYAAALADDPGSSVLTVTSLGMAMLSRRIDRPDGAPKRIVGLWRDATSGSRQIELPKGKQGLILELINQASEEWTADGRGDGGTTGRPIPKNPKKPCRSV